MSAVKEYRQIAVKDLVQHPDNPRKDLGDPEKLQDLANDIAQNGNTAPAWVVPVVDGDDAGKFLLVAGHRRAAAAEMAGVESLHCWVRDDLGTREKQIIAMLQENTQRENITPSCEAQAMATLFDLEGGSVKKLAKVTNRSEAYVRRRVQLAKVPAPALSLVDNGGLTLQQSEAFDEFKDNEEAYAELLELAQSDQFTQRDWIQRVGSLRRARDLPGKIAASEAALADANVKTIERNETYSGKYERIYSQDDLSPAEHAEAGHVGHIYAFTGEVEWYKKNQPSAKAAPKAELTEEQIAEKEALARISAGLQQAGELWAEFFRAQFENAAGGLPLTEHERRVRDGLAPHVLGQYPSAVAIKQVHSIIIGGTFDMSDPTEPIYEAIRNLRPLQMVMIMADISKPDELDQPRLWDFEGHWSGKKTQRWLELREKLFGYPVCAFEQEAIDHFNAINAVLAAERAAEDALDEEEDLDDDEA